MMIKKILFTISLWSLLTGISWSAALDPVISNGRVVFRYADKNAKSVTLVGSMNNWDKSKTPLQQKNGEWIAEISLVENTYEYKFVVDGEKWLPDGGNLKITLKKTPGGNIEIHRVLPDYNTPYSKKIFFSGEYFSRTEATRVRETDTAQTQWRMQEVLHDIDIRVKGKLNKNVEIFGELNYTSFKNGFDKRLFFLDMQRAFLFTGNFRKNDVELNEAHILINTPYYKIRGYLNEQVMILNDPLYTLEQINMDDRLYFSDESRPVADKNNVYSHGKGFGQGTVGMYLSSNLFGWNTQFLLSDAQNGGRDYVAFRTSRKFGPFEIGFPYFYNRDNDGAFGDIFRVGTSSDVYQDDGYDGFVEYPRGSGKFWHYSSLRIIDATDRNSDRSVGLDLRLHKGSFNVFAEFLKKRVRSAAAIYSRGDTLNTEFADFASGERSFGDDLDGSVLYLGGNYQLNKNLKGEISYRGLEGKSRTIDHNGTLLDISKSEDLVRGALRYESDALYAGVEINRVSRRGYPVTPRDFSFDDRGFYGLDVKNAGSEFNITSVFHLKPYEKLSIHYANRNRSFKLLVQGIDKEWTDDQHRFRVQYDWLKNFSTEADWRFVKYNLDRVHTYSNLYAGIIYQFNQRARITAGFGNNYRASLEKGYGRPWILMKDYYDIAVANDQSSGTPSETLVEDMMMRAEDNLDNDKRFSLEVDVNF